MNPHQAPPNQNYRLHQAKPTDLSEAYVKGDHHHYRTSQLLDENTRQNKNHIVDMQSAGEQQLWICRMRRRIRYRQKSHRARERRFSRLSWFPLPMGLLTNRYQVLLINGQSYNLLQISGFSMFLCLGN